MGQCHGEGAGCQTRVGSEKTGDVIISKDGSVPEGQEELGEGERR